MSNKSKFHFGSPELPYKHHSSVLRRSKRNQCENCGRFVTDQQLWYSDELGHSVCDHCEEMWVTCVDKAGTVESTPMDQYADYFEDIQNGGLQTYYYD